MNVWTRISVSKFATKAILSCCLVSVERLLSLGDFWQGSQTANQMDHLSDENPETGLRKEQQVLPVCFDLICLEASPVIRLKSLSFPMSSLSQPPFCEKGKQISHLVSGRPHSVCLITHSHSFLIILLYAFHDLSILFTLFSLSATHISFGYSLFLFFIRIPHYYIWKWDAH